MPTYEYECQACGHKFDHFQSMTSNRLRTCPECRQKKLVRLVGSGAGVIFKGSGFYETDYKRSSTPSKSSSGDESSSSSSGDSSDSSDSSDSATSKKDGGGASNGGGGDA